MGEARDQHRQYQPHAKDQVQVREEFRHGFPLYCPADTPVASRFGAKHRFAVASWVEIFLAASISGGGGQGCTIGRLRWKRRFPDSSRSCPKMPFQLPELPFAKDALAPHMSAETLEFHHGKHHKAYVTKTNELIEGQQDLSEASLIQVVREARRADNAKLFNNSAQLWNH